MKYVMISRTSTAKLQHSNVNLGFKKEQMWFSRMDKGLFLKYNINNVAAL